MQTVEGSSFFAAVREAGRTPRINPTKIKFGEITPANTNIDHANRIVLAYPIFQTGTSVICWRSTSSTVRIELQSPIRSYCVQHGDNGSQRIIALAKSLQRSKRVLALRGGSRCAGRAHRF